MSEETKPRTDAEIEQDRRFWTDIAEPQLSARHVILGYIARIDELRAENEASRQREAHAYGMLANNGVIVDDFIAYLTKSNAKDRRIAELERITGPVLTCCGRRAVEHAPATELFAVPHYYCKSSIPIVAPPEYIEWLKERG